MEYEFPRILPAGWVIVEKRRDGFSYIYRAGSLASKSVIVSVNLQLDGKLWIHASVAKPDRMPTWEDLREMKDIWIGKDREAYQVLPRAEKYVNQHPYCLHIWARVDGKAVLPDFTQGGRSL